MNKKVLAWTLLAVILSFGTALAEVITPECTYEPQSPSNQVETDNDTLSIGVNSTLNATSVYIDFVSGLADVNMTSPDVDTLGNVTWSQIFTNIPEGTYRYTATAYYYNDSNEENSYNNLSALSAGCGTREFTIDTKQGSIVPILVAQEQAQGEKKDLNMQIFLFLLLAGLAFMYFMK